MKRILAILAIILLPVSAAAADIDDRIEKAFTYDDSPNMSWTRFWAAAIAGYGMTNTSVDVGPVEVIDGIGGEGVFGELQVGFDKQMGKAVMGVYAGAGLSDSETSVLNGFGSVEELESYFVGARAGYLLSHSTLAYVGGGWAWTNVETFLAGASIDERFIDGVFAETGLEGRLNHRVGWKVFGRYTFYDEETPVNGVSLDPGRLQVGAGLTISLN